MKILRLAVAVLLSPSVSILAAQPPPPAKDASGPPVPLIVDAHPAPYRAIIYPQTNLGHGRFDMKNASVLDLVTFAFDRYDYAILGGPTWIDLDRFDVAAKVDTPPLPKADANAATATAAPPPQPL